MVISFGVWQIIEEVGIVANDSVFGEYIIDKSRLWEVYEWESFNLSDWAVHLSEKTWMTETMLSDLFNALIFSQEYFVHEKKVDVSNISWVQTMHYAKHLIKQTKDFAKIEVGNVDINDIANAFKIAGNINTIKPLLIPQ